MINRLGANTGSYHRHSLATALEGIAAAGYRYVELAAIPGVVQHVPLAADERALNGLLRQLNAAGRIALLIPPPRKHRHRYFGVLAQNSP